MSRSMSRSIDNALETTTSPSWPLILNGILTVTAQLMRKELTPGELLLWGQILSNCQIEGLRWAFATYVRGSKFFPVPAEIIELYSTWVRDQREKKREAEARAEREETERRRARGETCGIEILHDFAKQLSVEKAMPTADPNRRDILQEQKVRIARAIENVRQLRGGPRL